LSYGDNRAVPPAAAPSLIHAGPDTPELTTPIDARVCSGSLRKIT
jgi:hypothetical protein